jgi:hypothetical protein
LVDPNRYIYIMASKKRVNTLTYIEETPKHHGKLVRVARKSVKESIEASKEAGLYITYAKGSSIVREYPDGRIETIGVIEGEPTTVKQGVKLQLS